MCKPAHARSHVQWVHLFWIISCSVVSCKVLNLFFFFCYPANSHPFPSFIILWFFCAPAGAWRVSICSTDRQSGEKSGLALFCPNVQALIPEMRAESHHRNGPSLCGVWHSPNQISHAVVCWSAHEFIFLLLFVSIVWPHDCSQTVWRFVFTAIHKMKSPNTLILNGHVCCWNFSTWLNFTPRIMWWLTRGLNFTFFFLRHCFSV